MDEETATAYLIGIRLREPLMAEDYLLTDLELHVGDFGVVETGGSLSVGQVKRPRRPLPAIPWRLLIWVAAFVAVFAVSRVVGGVEGYLLMLVALAAGSLRLDRQLGPVPRGMRDYQA